MVNKQTEEEIGVFLKLTPSRLPEGQCWHGRQILEEELPVLGDVEDLVEHAWDCTFCSEELLRVFAEMRTRLPRLRVTIERSVTAGTKKRTRQGAR